MAGLTVHYLAYGYLLIVRMPYPPVVCAVRETATCWPVFVPDAEAVHRGGYAIAVTSYFSNTMFGIRLCDIIAADGRGVWRRCIRLIAGWLAVAFVALAAPRLGHQSLAALAIFGNVRSENYAIRRRGWLKTAG